MTEVIALYAWYDQDDGGKQIVATFVATDEVPEPRVRAHEVMRRMTADGLHEVSMSIEELAVNPTNKQLGLKPTLSEIAQSEFVDVAARELMEQGYLQIPLWVNPAWLVHEVRANYDVGIDFKGRRMELVSQEEMERRVNSGLAPERRSRAMVLTEDDDAGFTETQ